jgi:hypothetical protein
MRKRVHALHRSLARRPWTPAERRVVWRGVLGRLFIAIEPLVCASVFGFLLAGLIHANRPDAPAIAFAPVFAVATIAFLAYAVVLMAGPVRAFAETFSPILIVDGYVRYRKPDLRSDPHANGYVAVLGEERELLCEWESIGRRTLIERAFPAMVQFTLYGGILQIDGVRTSAFPADLPPLGIGATTTGLPR